MPRSDWRWPTRRGKRKPLDVIAAQEELARVLRKRFLDAIEAERVGSSPGVDATRHFTVYSKAVDGLAKLQLETGQLERAGSSRGGREALRFGGSPDEYAPDEEGRMEPGWVFKDVKFPEPGSQADPDPAGDDA